MDTILAMGFAEYQAKKALAETGGNAEAAINYIMVRNHTPARCRLCALRRLLLLRCCHSGTAC